MSKQGEHFYKFGPFCLNAGERLLTREGVPVVLTSKCFDTLVALVQNSGHILKKDELLKMVWPDTFVEEATLAQNIFLLRKALGEDQNGNKYIETIPKHGYRFVSSVQEVADEDRSPFLEPTLCHGGASAVGMVTKACEELEAVVTDTTDRPIPERNNGQWIRQTVAEPTPAQQG